MSWKRKRAGERGISSVFSGACVRYLAAAASVHHAKAAVLLPPVLFPGVGQVAMGIDAVTLVAILAPRGQVGLIEGAGAVTLLHHRGLQRDRREQ